MSSHSAIGPALGYYYQAIFALIKLFDSKNDNAFVSIETFDDVYHEDGATKTLHQLKHKTSEGSKISVKDEDLWNTLKVWCDFLQTNNPNDGIFTLSTVASIDDKSQLNVLKTETNDRSALETELLNEAQRVIDERKKVITENEVLVSNGQKEKNLPFESKYKGCEAFLRLDDPTRRALLKNARINTDIFNISEAEKEIIKRIRTFTKRENQQIIAEYILAWWDREAVRSLTTNRGECLFYSELQEFISKKIAELYNDGFTDDIDEIELPPPDTSHVIHKQQLEIIDASATQKRRSFKTEVKARIQRDIWMRNNFSSITKLKKYDELLIEQWSYNFDEIDVSLNDEQKKEKGRTLLDWSHNESHNQVKPISPKYNNPDLIRGSYQILSKDKRVGWHCDYKTLISDESNE